jgi:uncharacterized protein
MSPTPSLLARALMALVRVYQIVPTGVVSRCRFAPTCSEYALGALRLHGAGRGLWLTVRRLGRCHPFHPGGMDPVPAPVKGSAAGPPREGATA